MCRYPPISKSLISPDGNKLRWTAPLACRRSLRCRIVLTCCPSGASYPLFLTSSEPPAIPSQPPALAVVAVFTTGVLMPQVKLRRAPPAERLTRPARMFSLASTYQWSAVMNWWWRNDDKKNRYIDIKINRLHYLDPGSPESPGL